MKVKQLIYTSWKNGSSTKKGFMVYSKSAGISPEDENAITSAMRYTTLPSLPYTPTWEEIETLFPRNNSYFRLPSGKYCFAQSSYLGKDYSGRTGNYIIHAYISDAEPDFNQFNLIRSDVFKRSMTQEELDAESNPPPLPEIDIEVPDNSGDIAMLKQFFTPDKKDNLRYFVEAVLQGVAMKKTVYAFDEQPNLACWYKALYYCLPAMTRKQVTYSTYSCYVPNDIAVACVKAGTIFNYDMNLSMGNFVYNFKDNKINKIAVSAYTDRIVDEFYKDPAGAAMFASSLETYMPEANGDLMLAIQLSKFYSGGYSSFNTPQTLGAVFGCVTKSGRIPAAQLGDIIGNIITNNTQFNVSSNADMYRYVMDNASEDMRFTIIKQYSEARFARAVSVNSYDSEYKSLVNGAPFDWKEFLAYINKRVGKDKFINAYGVTSFAAYALVLTVLDYGTTIEVNDKFIPDYARTIAKFSDLSLFNCFYKVLGSKGMAQQVAAEITASYELFADSDYKHSFDLLTAIKVNDITTGACAYMIRRFGSDGNFSKCAEKFLAANPAVHSEIERLSTSDPAIKAFLDNMVSVQFLARTPDEAALTDFFNRHYGRNAEMKDVFFKGLKKRLAAEPLYTERAKMALTWCEKVSSADPSQRVTAMQIARDVIFDRRTYYIEFAKFYKEKAKAIESFVQGCKASGVELKTNYYDIAKFAEELHGITGRTYKKSTFVPTVLKTGILAGFADSKFAGKIIAENYLEDIFNLYGLILENEKSVRQANTDFINNVLSPVVEAADVKQNDEFCAQFNTRLDKLKGDTYLQCMSALIAHTADPANAKSGITFLTERYFGGMQKKKIEKFFEEIQKESDILLSKEMKKYIIEKINSSENVGFFARLFGKKK